MTTRYDIPKSILALLMAVVLIMGQLPLLFSSVAVADDVVPVPYIEDCGPRLVVKNAAEGATFQWQISGDSDAIYSKIDGATNNYYDIKESDEDKFIQVVVKVGDVSQTLNYTDGSDPAKVGKLVVFDISKGNVSFGSTCTGVLFGNDAASSLTHETTNIYVIKQSDPSMTGNVVSFSGNLPDAPFDVTLDDVNMGEEPTNLNQDPGKSGSNTPTKGYINIPAKSDGVKHVTLRLKGENIVRNITYYNGGDVNAPQTVHSSLKITDINGDGATSGSLYIPVKKTDEEIDSFVALKTNYNHWNAGIGGTDGSSLVQNLEIAGGSIQVLTTLGDNCTAIGAGGNGYCQMEISGGNVTAHCNGTGAAIGGGIGWNAKGGRSDVLISGGTVYAKNHGNLESGGDIVGGVAIGSGSSFVEEGTEGKVVITGGTVTASGTFGNGIGGGNSSSSKGGSADISISGGTVNASSIGGGNSKKGVGGDAEVTISGNADVTIIGGIGGGDGDTLANEVRPDGGAATITVTGGRLACGGVIGGGAGGDTGNGGEATIKVSGGVLVAKSIGGGTGGNGGNGGAAEVSVSGGTILTGSIGGGNAGEGGQLGYATADISGGDISGQFLMAATGGSDSDPSCSFTMTGGTLRSLTEEEKAQHGSISYVKPNGGAVYMDDPKGEVSLSGGTIQGWSAVNGGAIYMTAGTFNLSGTGAIKNCYASGDGGAVYLGGGEVNVSGGEISGNTAENNGGGVAVENGNFRMTGGVIGSADETKGNIARNGMGGGVYVSSDNTADVVVKLLSGSVVNNSALKSSGGALAVVGPDAVDPLEPPKRIDVFIGVNDIHFDANGNRVPCEHADPESGEPSATSCPVIKGNKAAADGGGAVYVSGGANTTLNIYCLTEEDNTEAGSGSLSNFMRMKGGKVLISTSSVKDEATQNATHGCISIEGTMYVTGGQIDIWGDTLNPRIQGVMTVDIKKEGDYFDDHRSNDGYYKLVYFENFKDPGTGFVSGQYKAVDIEKNDSVIINGSIYSHPGYEIIGWNTDKDGKDDFKQKENNTQAKGWYEIDESYVFDGNPIGDLTIFAIWEANGYVVVFDPNVPDGEVYSGTMANQQHSYNQKLALSKNQFSRTGYAFVGWTRAEDGTGKVFKDEEEVTNLAEERGEVVTLYAKWTTCDHDATRHAYTYSVVDDGKTLRRDCQCGAYHETATLSASDVVYDKAEHPANVTYSHPDKWKPSLISYSAKVDGAFAGMSAVPKNAGAYLASITLTSVLKADGTTGDVTASVQYVIEKAEQPGPSMPEYEAVVQEGNYSLKVKHVDASPLGISGTADYDPTYDSVAEYQVVYYNGATPVPSEWVEGSTTDGTHAASFNMPVALTSYFVYARYSEGTNYKASEPTRADGEYFFAGGVTVSVSCGEGVSYELKQAAGGTGTNGIALEVSAQSGYYLPDVFIVGAVTNGGAGDQAVWSSTGTEFPETSWTVPTQQAGPYQDTLIGIPSNGEIVITIPAAVKLPAIEVAVAPNRVFGDVSSTEAIISRDSSYTMSFKVDSYDGSVFGNAEIAFNSALPKNTKLILADKTNGAYYHVTLTDSASAFPLATSFVRMGAASGAFALPSGTADLHLQLIVDFSAVTGGMAGTSLDATFSMKANKDTAKQADDVSASASVDLVDAPTFALSVTNDGASSGDAAAPAVIPNTINTFTFNYVASTGADSKWDDRATALVLIPENVAALPSDARMACSIGNTSVVTSINGSGQFVIPLPSLDVRTVRAELVSNLFPDASTSYLMDAKWLVAYSEVATSPANGDVVFEVSGVNNVSFTANPVGVPSVNITCMEGNQSKHLFRTSDTLNATVSWLNIPPDDDICKMRATVLYNNNGNYVSTGKNIDIVDRTVNGSKSLSIPLGIYDPAQYKTNSFCLRVEVMQGVVKVMDVRYYFIIQ